MQYKDKLKPAHPHLIAVLIFIVVSFVYFYPVLEGKVLKANDSTVSKINSKEIQDFRDKNGREPLWTNSIFSGKSGTTRFGLPTSSAICNWASIIGWSDW